MVRLLPLIAAVALSVAIPGLGSGFVPRAGFVTLQFDDTYDLHYTHIFPALQEHGLRASFGCVTERSALGIEHDAWKLQAIYQAGHEIQDHTTRHNYLWATHVDTLIDDGIDDYIPYTFANIAIWDSLCRRSLDILDSLGIEVTGWNQPGGELYPGCVPGHPNWKWANLGSDSLYQLIATMYTYTKGYGTFSNTAHFNLRGHNCPDRYPLFNVPHNTIDYMSLDAIKTGIADAVASGLWYIAVSHSADMDQVHKVEALIDWLDQSDIEVLTCGEGVQRIMYCHPDPLENQLPQARMLCDLDSNGKPDGFTGSCAWDTLTAPPVQGVRCLRVDGDCTFLCYGPELGANSFSVWLKSAADSVSTVRIIYTGVDFDWHTLGWVWNTVQCSGAWTKVDPTGNPGLSIDVADDVDRLSFIIRASASNPVLVAYPELSLVPSTGVGAGDETLMHSRVLVASPNPVRAGSSLRITPTRPVSELRMYDIEGRCVLTMEPPSGRADMSVSTEGLSSGIFFVSASPGPGNHLKIVVVK